jgi:hypothetical protein
MSIERGDALRRAAPHPASAGRRAWWPYAARAAGTTNALQRSQARSMRNGPQGRRKLAEHHPLR